MTDRKMQALARKAFGNRANAAVYTGKGSGYIVFAGTEYLSNSIEIWYGDPRVAKAALAAALQVIVDEREKTKARKGKV